MALREKVNERSKLLSQLEQAKMQEKVSESLNSMNELSANGNSPSLDAVRDKIERRYSKALGQAELAENSVSNRMQEIEQAGVQLAGHSRLEQIRAEMNNPKAVEGNSQQAIGSAETKAQPNVQDDAVQARLRELRGE